MRVLLSGSSGLVGTVVASRLMDLGHEVVGLSRHLTKSNRRLTRAIAADLGKPGLADSVLAGQSKCDAIVHAAAAIEFDPYSPAIALTNGLGTQQMLELARRWDVSSFVYLSSVPVIGVPLALPVTEDHPTAPRTAYHASKLFGEHLCAVASSDGTPAVSLRLTSPVGPGMPKQTILSTFVRRALDGERLLVAGTGSRTQDYVDVRDVAVAVEAALERQATGVFNVASGCSISNLELARRCIEVLSSRSEVRFSGAADPDDGLRWDVSIERATEHLGYRPLRSIADSIETLADGIAARQQRGADDG